MAEVDAAEAKKFCKILILQFSGVDLFLLQSEGSSPSLGIRKRRGGPHVHPRKIKHIAVMYSNPEFKEFNRGSRNDYPDGWWDNWYRVRERNWKSQRCHQWKEK